MNSILESARLPFLLLTPVCLSLGISFAWIDAEEVELSRIFLVVIAGFSAHLSVNLLNEYIDFTSGLDAKTIRTPFSGGSGSLLKRPDDANKVLNSAVGCVILTVVIGLYLSFSVNPLLLLIGSFGMLLVIAYTPVINRFPWLCLIAPGLAFGPLMVVGTYIALTGLFSWPVLMVSFIPFFLVNNLLLLNQFPDVEADKTVGRRHFPIAYGLTISGYVYLTFLAAAAVTLWYLIYSSVLSNMSFWVMIPLSLGLVCFWGVLKHSTNFKTLTRYLALNVAITLLSPVVLITVHILTR